MPDAKSIGWLPTKVHFPDTNEASEKGYTSDTLVVDEWLLIEYAVGTIPVNPETVTQVVSKTMLSDQELAALGWDQTLFTKGKAQELPEAKAVPFTSWAEVEKCIERKLGGVAFESMAKDAIERAFGKV